MGEALVGGLVSSGWAEVGELHVVEPDGDRRADLEAAVPGLSCGTEPLDGVDALIAVKPQMMGEALPALRATSGGRTLFVSIAAGTTIAATGIVARR